MQYSQLSKCKRELVPRGSFRFNSWWYLGQEIVGDLKSVNAVFSVYCFRISSYLLSMFFLSRERQDADGQMKELQDQLEAEQYFSVCFMLLHFYINLFTEYNVGFSSSPSAIRCFMSLTQSYLFLLCLSSVLSAALILITEQYERVHVEKCPTFVGSSEGGSQAAHFSTVWIIFCWFQAFCIQHLFRAVW